MAGKIPVGATLAQAFGFAFRDFFKILGTMWIALAVSWIPSIYLQQRMMTTGRPALVPGSMGLVFVVLYAVLIILVLMQVIGIARLALGLRKGPYWFYFSLGKPVWRLLGNSLLFLLAAFIGGLILALGLGLFSALLTIAANAAGMPALTATITFVRAIAGLAVWGAAIYCFVRLTFLLLPVVAADVPGLALGRAWTLGRGNFWRMFVIMVVIWMPLILLEAALAYFFLLKGVPLPSPGVANSAAFQAALNANILRMAAAMQQYWFVIYPLAAIVAALIYGIMIGAQCFAWRALTAVEMSSDEIAGG